MIDYKHSFLLIAVIALATILLRFLPFLIFRGKTPDSIVYLGKVLPYSVMSVLVVYCLKDTNILNGLHGIPEAVAALSVILLHKWKHNTLLSITCGTLIYMVLIRVMT